MVEKFFGEKDADGVDFSVNRVTLAFMDDTLEGRFKKSYFEINLRVGRACHLIAVFFYFVVGMWDAVVVDPSRLAAWCWVIAAVTLMFLCGLAASCFAPKFYAAFWQQLFAFYVFITGAGFTVVTAWSAPEYPLYNFVGIIFCLFFCYAFIRLTFVWAVLAGNAIVIIYTVCAWIFVSPPLDLLLTGFFYMFGINLLGMMVCYALELMSRRDFMLNDMLKRAEKKTWEMNVRLEQMVKERTRELKGANRELKSMVRREKELVARLEKEEKKLRTSLSSLEQAESIARLGYFERNWRTGKGYWSRGFFRLLGERESDGALTHETFMGFVHEEDRTRVAEHIRESIAKRESMDIEFRLVRNDGEVIHIHGIADNFHGDDGKLSITRGTFQDVTDRRQAEIALKEMEARFVQAQKMESIGRLAGGVAHDYNNISSVVMGYAEMAMESAGENEELRSDLREILNAAGRAVDITRQLLAFARRQTIAPRAVDLNRTVDSILKILGRLMGEDIDLVWKPGENIWPLMIDPSQVDQVLANLCVNARDAISGVGKVTIETRNVSFGEDYCAGRPDTVPGDFLMLSVGDDGKGMDRQTLGMIFEPFFTTKGVGRGTGLGLATVYGIVRQNGGFVNVYSEPEKGTVFKIYLPRHAGEKVEADNGDSAEIKRGRGETLLLVEDDPAILRIGRKMLQSIGYGVLAANSPGEAVELAGKTGVDIRLLITDVVMPEMNGRELADRLKAMRPGLKTLFMSGYTANIIAHRGVLEKGFHFIPKPFSRNDLAIKVAEALREEQA